MFASPAYAQTAAAAHGGAAAMLIQFAPLIAIFAIFYFLMIRPQQRRAKEFAAMIAAVKKGDEVVTSGGIIGKVTRVADAELEIEAATGVKLRIRKGMLAEVVTRPLPAAANDAKS